MKAINCPACGSLHQVLPDHAPDELVVCTRCGSYLRYRQDMTLRLLADAELAALDEGTQFALSVARNSLTKAKA